MIINHMEQNNQRERAPPYLGRLLFNKSSLAKSSLVLQLSATQRVGCTEESELLACTNNDGLYNNTNFLNKYVGKSPLTRQTPLSHVIGGTHEHRLFSSGPQV